jgi:ABC-2 type transport system permease protein
MKPFFALLRKHIHDTRGTLLLSAAALFALGWLFVFVTSRYETEIIKALESDNENNALRWLRNMGLTEQPPSVSIMMSFWSHPSILLILSMWAIGRASAAVGAEVERGTLDLILSRPVSRSSYLLSHVLVAIFGLFFLALALAVGARIGAHYNYLRVPFDFPTLLNPALNLAALGLPIYGYSLLVSAVDHVKWRSTIIGSVLTLAGFIAWVISVIPVLEKYAWRAYLERISIFKLYNPVDDVSTGESLLYNLSVLAAIGMGCVLLSFLLFVRRDLPSS